MRVGNAARPLAAADGRDLVAVLPRPSTGSAARPSFNEHDEGAGDVSLRRKVEAVRGAVPLPADGRRGACDAGRWGVGLVSALGPAGRG
jgi:hypothetical protein